MPPRDRHPARPQPLPRAIWVLGFVSLLMDIASEMVHSLLPLFLVSSLGVSVIVVGVIEGVAEATALGVALWGLHMGITQGLLSAMVAEAAPADLRGTAFGLFNLVSGVAMLLASVIAGVLWERLGPQATFVAGGAFAGLALLGLVVRGRAVGAAGP